MNRFAATGFSYGPTPDPRHARIAVSTALKRSGHQSANGVLLFLSSGFIEPEQALREASRAAGSLQVSGCQGESLMTENEWLLDVEGAVALVVHDPIQLSHVANPPNSSIDFCSPESISAAWLDAPSRRFGAVASAMTSRHHNQVWAASRTADNGHAEIYAHGTRSTVRVSRGIHPLTPPVTVKKTDGYRVLEIGRYPALNVLSQAIPSQYRQPENQEINSEILMGGVVFGDPDTAIANDRYHLNQVVSADREAGSITFSDKLVPGEHLFLAISDRLAAERDMAMRLEQMDQELSSEPEFGLYLPCLSRQPTVGTNTDLSLEVIKSRYPGLPIIGFYGHGQIAPLKTGSQLHFHSAGIGLFAF